MIPLVCSHCQTACAAPPGYAGQGLLCPTCGQLITSAAPLALPVGASYSFGETPLASPAALPAYGGGDVADAQLLDDAPAAETIAAPRRRSRLGAWLLLLMLLMLGTLLLLTATGIGYVAFARARGEPVANPLGGGSLWSSSGDAPESVHWSPAATHSASAGPARVKVLRVEIGEARGKDAAGNVIVSDGEFLQILLRIENNTPLPLEYRSWYGNDFPDPPNSQQTPQRVRLRDDADRAYSWVLFDDVERVRWHTPKATILPRKAVDDVIIFDLPAGATKAKLQFLRLELPAAAVGYREGAYRFEIPRTMIEGLDS